jgi:hypothetical protein
MFAAVGTHAAFHAELAQACQSRRPVILVLGAIPVSPPNRPVVPRPQISGYQSAMFRWLSSLTNSPENTVLDGVNSRNIQQWLAPVALVTVVTPPLMPRHLLRIFCVAAFMNGQSAGLSGSATLSITLLNAVLR